MRPSVNFLKADQHRQRSGFARFMQNAYLALVALALLFLLVAMTSHRLSDPAWSSSGLAGALTHNRAGHAGAWVADIVFYAFGLSAWWLTVALVMGWTRAAARFLRGERRVPARHGWGLRWGRRIATVLAVVSLLGASCTLEWAWLYRLDAQLPGGAGGALGAWLGVWGQRWVGFSGLVLLALPLSLLASAQVFGFSWLRCAERVGACLEIPVVAWRARQALREDQRVGARAAVAREQSDAGEVAPVAARVPEAAQAGWRRRWTAVCEWWSRPDLHRPSVSPAPQAAAPVPASVSPAPSVKAEPVLDFHPVAWAASPPEPVSVPESAPQEAPPPVPEKAVPPTVAPAVFVPPPPPPPWEDLPPSPEPVPLAHPVEPEAVVPVVAPVFEAPAPASRDAVPLQTPPAPVSRPAVSPPPPPLLPPAPVLVRLPAVVPPSFDSEAVLPSVELLDPAPSHHQATVSPETLEMTSRLIEKKLRDFGVQVTVVAALPGPVITRYEIEPATGVKGAQIVNLAKDLARSLSLVSIRVIETIPGKNLMALELPNTKRQTIKLREILGSTVYQEARSVLTMGLGKDIASQVVVADLAKMPHCLVAGTTGSGKSVGINAMILSLLFKAEPSQVRLLLIDPKMLELSVYEGIPHLLCPVVTDMKQAANGLNWCVAEMEKRYKLMSKVGVRNLAGYNAKIEEAYDRGEAIGNPFSLTPEAPEPLERLPHIVVVIDELADLMMVVGKKIEELIARLAQKARAAGIHLILATQRPSVDVITGLIKANIPTRMSFQVSSKIDSRTILDQMGAEALLGMGDMLYMPSGTGYPTRVHGAFVSDDEVHRVVNDLKARGGEPDYVEGILEAPVSEDGPDGVPEGGDSEKDPLYDQAVAIVLQDRKASISYVQRKLKIGYNRSARLLEAMEMAGLVSALTSSGQRDILVAARPEG